MDNLQGKLFVVWLLATPAACALAWWLGSRYRAALVVLMRAPLAAPGGVRTDSVATTVGMAQLAVAMPSWRPHALPTLAAWRRAEWRLVALLLALSLAIALTRGAITQWQVVEGAWGWWRWLTLAAIFAWPVLPAIGTLQRWSRAHLAAALVAWFAASLLLVMARSTEAQSLGTVALWLAAEIGPPALAFLLLTLRRTRAAAPWLWPPLALLALAAILGLDALAWMVNSGSRSMTPLVTQLVRWIAPGWAMVLFALAAIAIAWWPVQRFAHMLAHQYAQGRISDLMVLFSAAWALNLAFDALASGPLVLLPLLWIPLALAVSARWQARRGDRAPTLLVLRVFKQDANVSALFDDVVERWRVAGNTVLIAGTDLVDQTLDAADLFDFLDGRLAARFVRDGVEVPRSLAAFSWTPDADGRYRVNECYCHDSTWQVALAALMQRADLVLMDLRGFQAHNAGCRFELGAIARAAHVQRVVVLTDPSTDKAVAQSDAAAGPPGRFVWIELPAPHEPAGPPDGRISERAARRLPGDHARREAARRVRAALVSTADETSAAGPLAARLN